MKRINKKGFTLVELLGAIVIMGIMMLTAGVAVSIHMNKARKTAYDTMASSAKSGATQYVMEYPGTAMTWDEYRSFEEELNKHLASPGTVAAPESLKVITFERLVDNTQLQRPADPADKTRDCKGKIIAILNEDSDTYDRALDSYSYVIHQCCTLKQSKYTFTEEYRKKSCTPSDTDDCTCDPSLPDPDKTCAVVDKSEMIENEEGDPATKGIWCD